MLITLHSPSGRGIYEFPMTARCQSEGSCGFFPFISLSYDTRIGYNGILIASAILSSSWHRVSRILAGVGVISLYTVKKILVLSSRGTQGSKLSSGCGLSVDMFCHFLL